MRRYKQVPGWWFICILVANIAATMFTCHYYNDQLQLQWWGVLLACGLALFFTLPVGVIYATTNQVQIHANILHVLHFCIHFSIILINPYGDALKVTTFV